MKISFTNSEQTDYPKGYINDYMKTVTSLGFYIDPTQLSSEHFEQENNN